MSAVDDSRVWLQNRKSEPNSPSELILAALSAAASAAMRRPRAPSLSDDARPTVADDLRVRRVAARQDTARRTAR